MRRLTLLALTLAAFAALPAAAHAGGTLTAQKNVAHAGTVTAGGKIDCGLSCTSGSAFFANVCSEGECEAPEVFVFGSPRPGWSAAYDGCTDEGENSCMVIMTVSRQVTVTYTDVADPTVTINGPAAGAAVRGTIALGATAADNDAVTRVEFYANGAKLGEDSTAPYALPVDTAALGDGARTLSVRSFDPSGRASAPATRAVVVDNSRPTASITGGPADGALVGAPGDVSYVFAGHDSGSGVAQMQCALDGGSVVACDSATAHTLSGVAEGPQRFLVRAVDAAGNAGDWVQRSFTVDRTRPELSITAGPADEALIGRPGTVGYAFQAGDASGVTVTCAVDGAFGPCSSANGHTVTGLPDGPHTVSIRAIDGAGNQRVLARSFSIDTTAPTVAITGGPAEGAAINSRVARFSYSIEDASPGLGALECAEDGGAFGSCDGMFSHDMWGIADGPHSFALRVVDSAGNATTVTRTFRVDTTAPETTVDGHDAGVFRFSASEAGATFRCRVYAAGAIPPAFGDCSGNGRHAAGDLSPGDYVFEVVATDAAGHADETPATRAFTIAKAATPTTPATPGGTTAPGDTSAPGGGTAQPQAERLDPRWTAKFRRAGKRTRVRRLQLTGIAQGATVEVRCSGKGCAFTKRSAPKGGAVDLLPLFKRRALAAGTRIEIRVTKPGATGRVVTFRVRARGKAKETAGYLTGS